ncbi:multiple coagulation factor deficiency protein 2 homolog isoform X1 [Pieris napi]|uniref:multiple coagulation factor deficiency protein 2 homolog isoform X1 n=1 Tax=Pieris napi TaxID=78633 RepID=UPI001FBC0A33|nr:multiple coagulation factor deficiency protein 2 homolog isoform X1 [Pieris napi]
MWLEAVALLFLSSMSASMRRGPHHPHGQGIQKTHSHYSPRGTEKLTQESQLLHDTKHIEEDIKVLTPELLANMTPEELEFHYFSAHDFDRNSMLDGLEMLKAVYHTMDHEHSEAETPIEPEVNHIDEYIALVDKTLETDDTDGDGYVSYAEYRAARLNNPSERTPRVVAAGSI